MNTSEGIPSRTARSAVNRRKPLRSYAAGTSVPARKKSSPMKNAWAKLW